MVIVVGSRILIGVSMVASIAYAWGWAKEMTKLVSCEEVAEAIWYLAAPTTFTTGADFLLDGGITGVRLVD